MSDSYSPPVPSDHQSPPTTDRAADAKDQATQVSHSAVDAGQHVAGVAKEQAANTAQETTRQAKDLLAKTRSELSEQAAVQQQRVAATLHDLRDELRSMSANTTDAGPATELIGQAAERTGELARWLEQREPGQLVDEVRRFARQRPGAFLAAAVGAGLLTGRLTRGIAADQAEPASQSDTAPSTATPTMAPGAPLAARGELPASPIGVVDVEAGRTPGYSVPPVTQTAGTRP